MKLCMTLRGNIPKMTSKKLKEQNYQMQLFGLSEAHAPISALQDGKKDSLKAVNPPCFLRLSDALKKGLKTRRRYLPIYSWRTLKLCYPAMEDGILRGCSLKWTKSGMTSNGELSTLPMSSLRTGKEYTLSDILEGGVRTRQVFPINRQSQGSAQAKINKVNNFRHQSQIVVSEKGKAPTLTATDYKHPQKVAVKQVGNIVKTPSFGGNPQRGRVYDPKGISPTLQTMQGGGLEPKILVKRPLKGCTKNGWHFEQEVFSKHGIAATLKAGEGSGNIPKIEYKPILTPDRINKRQNGHRFKNINEPEFTLTGQDRHGVLIDNGESIAIRKLTPKECWRLQGFSDKQFEKAKEAGVSDSQLYKQAGNAVTVPVIEQIGKRIRK